MNWPNDVADHELCTYGVAGYARDVAEGMGVDEGCAIWIDVSLDCKCRLMVSPKGHMTRFESPICCEGLVGKADIRRAGEEIVLRNPSLLTDGL